MISIVRLISISLLMIPFFVSAQGPATVTISGAIKDTKRLPIPYSSVVLKAAKDSAFVVGIVSNEQGQFVLSGVKSGNFVLELSMIGYKSIRESLTVGVLSSFLDLGTIEMQEEGKRLNEVQITTGPRDGVSSRMDKKTFTLANKATQTGGSVLQAMQNLPGVTVQDGKVQLRGNDKVSVLIDGKQNAVTGFGSQTGLDNIPASAIESIEIINNPSAK